MGGFSSRAKPWVAASARVTLTTSGRLRMVALSAADLARPRDLLEPAGVLGRAALPGLLGLAVRACGPRRLVGGLVRLGCGGRLRRLGARLALRALVLGEVALFVLLAGAAGARIVAAEQGRNGCRGHCWNPPPPATLLRTPAPFDAARAPNVALSFRERNEPHGRAERRRPGARLQPEVDLGRDGEHLEVQGPEERADRVLPSRLHRRVHGREL